MNSSASTPSSERRGLDRTGLGLLLAGWFIYAGVVMTAAASHVGPSSPALARLDVLAIVPIGLVCIVFTAVSLCGARVAPGLE